MPSLPRRIRPGRVGLAVRSRRPQDRCAQASVRGRTPSRRAVSPMQPATGSSLIGVNIVARHAISTVILFIASGVAIALVVGGASGPFPLGFVNDDFTSALLGRLAFLWIGSAATLIAVSAAVRIGFPDRLISRSAARAIGSVLVVLTTLWMAFLGWLVLIGAGPLLALMLTFAAAGPALLLTVGICAQGWIRSSLLAVVPPALVFVLSVAATVIAVSLASSP